nr:BofC C-terminal domain-containing protein [uncultured Caproiciproducens sp.]
MKKSWIVLLCTTAIIIGMLAWGFSQTRMNETPELISSNILNNSTSNEPSSQENSEITTMASRSSTINTYTVKEYEGHIGVFYNNENTPYQEIDVEVASLPKADQTLLKNGIKVTDVDRLNSIIEDYES